jgi:GGDEF domain-containing protein
LTTVPSTTVLTKFQKWLLGESELPEGESSRYGTGPRSLSRQEIATSNLGEIEARLCQILTEQPTVTAGRIFFIDLEGLKTELADQWPNLAEVIDSVARTVFRRNLSGNDVYCKHGDGGFLVVFSTLSTASATIICQRIADDLRAMLMGKTGTAQIGVSTVVGQRDSRLLLQEVSLLDQAIRVSRPTTPASRPSAGTSTATPPGLAQTSFGLPNDGDPGWSQIRWHGDAEPPVAPVSPALAAMAKTQPPASRIVADEPGWEPLRIDRLNQPLPQERPTAEAPDVPAAAPTYLFQPVWDTQNKLLSTYHCLTPDEVASEPTCMAAGADLGEVDGDAVAAFDLNKLLNAADMLDELVSNYFQLFVSATVHAETMGSPRLRRQYLHVLRRIPEKLRKFLILQLYGLPAGFATGRIVECVTALRPNCGAILVETGLDPGDVAKFAGIGVHAVGADLRTVSPSEQRLFGDLARFAAEADKHRLWTFLTGVTKSSQIIGATAAGIRYLSGRRVGPASEVPMHIRQFNLEDFYRLLVSDRA